MRDHKIHLYYNKSISQFLSSIISFSKGEFIIKEGDIGTEMFFIIDGIVEIVTAAGNKITTLKKGNCFGEIAILKERLQTRGANVFALTNVSVAVLSKEDFSLICEAYPLIEKKVVNVAQRRSNENISTPRSRTVIRRSTAKLEKNIEIHRTEEEIGENEELISIIKASYPRLFLMALRFLVVVYNALFIPLQMAFKIKYTPIIYIIEFLVICLHLLDIAILINNIRSLNPPMQVENSNLPNKSTMNLANKLRKYYHSLIYEF